MNTTSEEILYQYYADTPYLEKRTHRTGNALEVSILAFIVKLPILKTFEMLLKMMGCKINSRVVHLSVLSEN